MQLKKARRFKSFNEALEVVTSGADRKAIRDFNFMNTGQPPSVGELARCLGFVVEFRNLPDTVSGFLEPDTWAENGFRIVINKRHSRARQRWTALHEIAHYYLHPQYRDPLGEVAFRSDVSGTEHFYSTDNELVEEREANCWVEAVVFEQSALDAARGLFGSDKAAMARHFGVSVSALEIVLKKR